MRTTRPWHRPLSAALPGFFSRRLRPLLRLAAGLALLSVMAAGLAGCSSPHKKRMRLLAKEDAERRAAAEKKKKEPKPTPSRSDQVLKPDPDRTFNFASLRRNQNSMAATSPMPASNRSMAARAPALPQRFRSRGYLTGAYQGRDTHWRGDFQYNATGARLASRSDPPDRTFGTKAVAAKSNAAGEKAYTTAEMPTRDYRGKEIQRMKRRLVPGKSRTVNTMDEISRFSEENAYTGPMTGLQTEEDVRELLNKNK